MMSALTALTALVLLCVAGCAPSSDSIGSIEEYERGSQRAASDLTRGRYKTLDNFGFIRYKTEKMRAELKRRYGINCELDHSLSSDYVRGYNVVMHAGAKEKFGDNYYENALQAVMPEGYASLGFCRSMKRRKPEMATPRKPPD